MPDLEEEAERAEDAGDFEGALNLWERLARQSRDPVFFCRYGRVAQELGKWSEAEDAFEQALASDPNCAFAMEGMGSLWVDRTDRTREESLQIAAEWFLAALKHNRNARTLTFLGTTYADLGQNEEARQALQEAIDLDQNYEEALYNLALTEAETEGFKAIHLLERAIDIDHNYSAAHRELGKLLHREGDCLAAEYHLKRALELNPADYWGMLFLANLYSAEGNGDAEKYFKAALALEPDTQAGFIFFANYLESLGRNDEAALVRKHQNP